ncbi:MAG: hypothetical protein M0Z95_20105 [Actinomycetota bacterium]|jgi:hypothetical protein|nr:hypothetical protein [Actinomycetota bacterium]
MNRRSIHHFVRGAASRSRDEDGFGLIDTLASIFLGAIIFFGVLLSFYLALQTNYLATASLGSSSSGAEILSSLQTNMGNAEPLGHCLTDPVGSYVTPALQCPTIVTTGPAVAAIGAGGFCFYAPASNAQTTTAPSFVCLVVDTDAKSPTAGNVYLLSYPPSSSATYTTCDPTDCWPGISGALLTSCEADPTLANCVGNSALPPPLGTIDLNFSYTDYPYKNGTEHVVNAHCASGTALDGPFQFIAPSGQCLTASSDPSAVSVIQATIAVKNPTNQHDYLLRSSVAINGP